MATAADSSDFVKIPRSTWHSSVFGQLGAVPASMSSRFRSYLSDVQGPRSGIGHGVANMPDEKASVLRMLEKNMPPAATAVCFRRHGSTTGGVDPTWIGGSLHRFARCRGRVLYKNLGSVDILNCGGQFWPTSPRITSASMNTGRLVPARRSGKECRPDKIVRKPRKPHFLSSRTKPAPQLRNSQEMGSQGFTPGTSITI